MTSIGIRDSAPPIGKFWRLRCVCAPQYLELSTSIGPKASDSVLGIELSVARPLVVGILGDETEQVGGLQTIVLIVVDVRQML